MSRAYLARVLPTYIENWAPALYALSIPQLALPLSVEEARSLEARLWCREGRLGTGAAPPIELLSRRLEEAIRCFPGGAFVRLGSRSGKDSILARTCGLRVETGESALRLLCAGSERVAFDLRLALRHGYSPYLFVRQWLDIPPWAEFRCFMKGRRLIGITQYDCRNLGHCPEISRNADTIEQAIHSFFPRFVAVSHLDDVVWDVFVEGIGTGTAPVVRLLELNPFFPKTDPVLFDWMNPECFDGSFRFL